MFSIFAEDLTRKLNMKKEKDNRKSRISRRDFMGAVHLGWEHGWKDDQRVPLV